MRSPRSRRKPWPPNIPSYSTAVSRLNALTAQTESHHSSYDRDLFPHWITISGSWNTREQVLKRDGSNVVVNSSCYPTSGSWYSPYDGATWTNPADVDIDHMVPLAEAWSSGTWAWSTSKRQTYANDLGGPELWAVTDDVNQAKGDKDPAQWQPLRSSFRCTYAKAWIRMLVAVPACGIEPVAIAWRGWVCRHPHQVQFKG